MKSRIILFLGFCVISINCISQNIKHASDAKKRQQQYQNEYKERQEQYQQQQRDIELKEIARIKKAQLNLNDLLVLLQSKDLEYVDKYLSERGWKLYETNIDEDEEEKSENESFTTNYKKVTWSFDKSNYNDLAQGWFYFYVFPNYDNAITYRIANLDHLNKIKNDLINNGYHKIQATDAINRGLESIYRNNLYEVTFKKLIKDEYEEGADIHYEFFIFNYKQIEERKAELERIAREEEEKENQYQSLFQQAENDLFQKKYISAKELFKKALDIKPENADLIKEKIAQIDIILLCNDADELFINKQFEKAKENYSKALLIQPNNKIEFIKNKIHEIETFQVFLKERTYKKYDYEDLEPSDYNAINEQLEMQIRSRIFSGEDISSTKIKIVLEIDTLGSTTSKLSISPLNNKVFDELNKYITSIVLKPIFINNYTAMSLAEYNYTIEYYHSIITVKKDARNIYSKNSDFSVYSEEINKNIGNAPFGIYTFDMNKTLINGKVINNNKLIKMNGTGGPSNMFLSLLIPGLGVKPVTGGEKNGLKRTLWVYGLIGSGIACNYWSNIEYDKYHKATTQTAMDEHYQMANSLNQLFMASVGIGASIWIYDIIWVGVRGHQNHHLQKTWKMGHLNAYYNHNTNATGLSYTINF